MSDNMKLKETKVLNAALAYRDSPTSEQMNELFSAVDEFRLAFGAAVERGELVQS